MAKKRKDGEGTLRLRKDGRWEGRIIIGYDEKDKAITKTVTARSKRACETKLKELRTKHAPAIGVSRRQANKHPYIEARRLARYVVQAVCQAEVKDRHAHAV